MAWPVNRIKTTKRMNPKTRLKVTQGLGPQALEPPRKTTLISLALGLLLSAGTAWGAVTLNPNYPKDLTNAVGTFRVTFQVLLTGWTGTPHYKWFHNETEINGATSSILALTNLQHSHAGTYYAAVTDDSEIWVTSRVATLILTNTMFVKITGQPIVEDAEPSQAGNWADYDGDGFMDLFVSNGSYNSAPRNTVYHNEGNGFFTHVSNALTTLAASSSGGNWADYNNDGRPDLYVSHIIYDINLPGGPWDNLYRNEGEGVFTLLNTPWVNGSGTNDWYRYTFEVAWHDWDGDGWLDLFAGFWDHPRRVQTAVFRNQGNDIFVPLEAKDTGSLHDDGPGGHSSPHFADYDNDGDTDVFVIHYYVGGGDRLHRNDGRGFFESVQLGSLPAGIDSVSGGWADYDNDGDFDLLLTDSLKPGALHRNEGGTNFVEVAVSAGIAFPAGDVWGPAWGDFDNDGDLDLFAARYGGSHLNHLYSNNGDGTFTLIDAGSPTHDRNANQGCPRWVDYDNDGFLDLFIACGSPDPVKNLLYRNMLRAGGNANHWLRVKLSGRASNRDGIGAKIRVKATLGGREVTQLRQIASHAAFASANELLAHFGLGNAPQVDSLRIEWPSGIVQEVANLAADQFLTVEEPAAMVTVNATQVGRKSYEAAAGVAVALQAPTACPGSSYQWQFQGQDLTGAQSATLDIASFQAGHIGPYSLVITGVAHPTLGTTTVRSAPIRLQMTGVPVLTEPRVSPPTTVSVGERVEIVLAISGTETYACQWQRDGQDIASAQNATATNATLVLDPVAAGDGGVYRAVVQGTAATVTSTEVSLRVDPTFTKITTGPVVSDQEGSESATWWDYDNDGFQDLFVARWETGNAPNSLYHNKGDGTFSRATLDAISNVTGQFMAGTVGDFNNDGREDLFTANRAGVDVMFLNEGAGQVRRLSSVEFGAPVLTSAVSACSTWVDYDLDGFLDLFVINESLADNLYRNPGEGPFIKMTSAQVGSLVADTSGGRRCSWADYDNDGDPDVWVVKTGAPNLLYRNDGHGLFNPVTVGDLGASGVEWESGTWGDYDNDGWLDLFRASSWQGTWLHRNLGGSDLTNVAAATGVAQIPNPLGGAFGDYDNDGYLDLFLASFNGVRSTLLRNLGDGTFASVDVGSPVTDGVGRLAPLWGDFNNDGSLDLFVACGSPWRSQRNLLYQNNGNGNGWLKVKLSGRASNRSGLGTKLWVQATIGGKSFWQVREITGNAGPSGGQGTIAHFGLGDATVAERLRIEWPSGIVQELANVAAKQMLTITEHQAGTITPPTLTAAWPSPGVVQLTVTGPPNLLYVFEGSTNLVQWTKLAVRTNVTGSVDYTDPKAGTHAQRYYRAVAP